MKDKVISLNTTVHKKEIARYLLRILDRTCSCADIYSVNEKNNTIEHLVIFNKDLVKNDTLGRIDRFIEYHCGSNEELIKENKNHKEYVRFTKERQITQL